MSPDVGLDPIPRQLKRIADALERMADQYEKNSQPVDWPTIGGDSWPPPPWTVTWETGTGEDTESKPPEGGTSGTANPKEG